MCSLPGEVEIRYTLPIMLPQWEAVIPGRGPQQRANAKHNAHLLPRYFDPLNQGAHECTLRIPIGVIQLFAHLGGKRTQLVHDSAQLLLGPHLFLPLCQLLLQLGAPFA